MNFNVCFCMEETVEGFQCLIIPLTERGKHRRDT